MESSTLQQTPFRRATQKQATLLPLWRVERQGTTAATALGGRREIDLRWPANRGTGRSFALFSSISLSSLFISCLCRCIFLSLVLVFSVSFSFSFISHLRFPFSLFPVSFDVSLLSTSMYNHSHYSPRAILKHYSA